MLVSFHGNMLWSFSGLFVRRRLVNDYYNAIAVGAHRLVLEERYELMGTAMAEARWQLFVAYEVLIHYSY